MKGTKKPNKHTLSGSMSYVLCLVFVCVLSLSCAPRDVKADGPSEISSEQESEQNPETSQGETVEDPNEPPLANNETNEDSEEPVVLDGGTKTIWLKGDKDHSKITLETSLAPSLYEDSKGSTKVGKVGFVVLSSERSIRFDRVKHKVLTKSDKKTASVNAKGVVSAKKAGIAYVYAYDTGSFRTEKFTINVLTAPTKIYLSDEPGSTDKENIIKKLTVYPDESEPVYIVETAGDGKVDRSATYSIVIEDDGNSGLTTTEVVREENGTLWFDVVATEKPVNSEKATSAKITVINNESGKKASLTAFLPNPIESMSVTGEGILKKKGDSVRLKVTYITPFGEGLRTTDTVKPYVSLFEPDIDENKISYEKAKEIKIKWDPKTGRLVVTAAKKIDEGGSVWFLIKDKNGEAYFERICTIDDTGELSINPRFVEE